MTRRMRTLSIVYGYASHLRLSVTRNGSHNIPRGRNIGINCALTDLVAFLDSDDYAAPEWTQVIIDTFGEYPETSLISGEMMPAYRTNVAHAIALNDNAIRRLFPDGILQFCTANCAINRKVLQDTYFDEDFKFAEDLELASRINRPPRQAVRARYGRYITTAGTRSASMPGRCTGTGS